MYKIITHIMQLHDSICTSGTAPITNRMATVTISGLQCGVTYNITAEGMLNGTLVGPGSPHEVVAAGPCPLIASVCMHNMKSTLCIRTLVTVYYCYIYNLNQSIVIRLWKTCVLTCILCTCIRKLVASMYNVAMYVDRQMKFIELHRYDFLPIFR